MLAKRKDIQSLLSNADAIRAERCRRDFFYFVQDFWEIIIAEEPVWNWHIPFLCKELEALVHHAIARYAKPYDLIINIPPGTTKSTVCTVMAPVWAWIAVLPEDEYPLVYKRERKKGNIKKGEPLTGADLRFITGSYSASLSLEHAELSRDIVRCEKFQNYFPDLEIRKDKDLKSNYKNNHGGARVSCSVGAMVTGKHAHIILIDDPIDPEKSLSEKDRPKANRWMTQTLSTRKVNKKNTPTVLIMQRLHEDDCSGHLANKGEKVRHLKLPGTDEFEISPPELEEYYVDGLLDPVRMDWDVIDDMRDIMGNYGFSGQVGQNPIPREGRIFEVENAPKIQDFNRNRILRSVRFWDKAGTEGGGKRTYGVLMHQMSAGPHDYIIQHVVKGQWKADRREKWIKDTAELDGRKVRVGIEQEPGSGGKESAENTIRNLAGWVVDVDKPTGDKFVRAEPFSIQFNAGNVAVVVGPWTQEFLDELKDSGPGAHFLDAMDSASGAFNMLSRPVKSAGTW